MSLRITEGQRGEVTFVNLSGHLVMGREADELKERVKELVLEKRRFIALNLEGVPYLDSYGVGELVACLTTVKKSGGGLKLVKPTAFVSDVLRATRLETMFEIHDSEETALAGFAGGPAAEEGADE